jgi:hypothetical protein
MIKKTQHTTQSGHTITVLDGLFSTSEITGIHEGILQLPYSISQTNATEVQNIEDRRLVSRLAPQHLDRFALTTGKRESAIQQLVPKDWSVWNAYINLGIKSDVQEVHVDAYDDDCQTKTLLYYANKEWQTHWGGETVFLDDSAQEIEYVVRFQPGRIVVFDSVIPHLAHVQTPLGPRYRFTIAVKYQGPNAR